MKRERFRDHSDRMFRIVRGFVMNNAQCSDFIAGRKTEAKERQILGRYDKLELTVDRVTNFGKAVSCYAKNRFGDDLKHDLVPERLTYSTTSPDRAAAFYTTRYRMPKQTPYDLRFRPEDPDNNERQSTKDWRDQYQQESGFQDNLGGSGVTNISLSSSSIIIWISTWLFINHWL